ncbi:M20/M25/M40 family metallo-hydrolase [Aestuariibacter sp. GS-14]|uniref:M20/M25/M40 family metallo-hydrolase n=1 Tax=Aestuariibacter sp. GS-14 TaxID=2590670 RepID=UPI00112BF922|nr:M20/M25/M40 family metallo-hydrolase [Aestuariibacter sp. GS-14]TPV59990.1 M20/M25/M40 family metallo-hydrolase [Aestuariibacter sp. GS-14]
MKSYPAIFALVTTLAYSHVSAQTNDTSSFNAAKSTLPEYLTFLSLPNVASESAENMQKNAQWLANTYRKYGFKTQLLAEPDNMPMVYAEYEDTSPNRPTILFYAHFDGQPVSPEQWAQPDPWQPVLKEKRGNYWEVLPLSSLLDTASPNPEWRVFARSASDDKAPIMMLLAAIKALRDSGKSPAVNIKVLLDSREENGSPTLKKVILDNREKLNADAAIFMDGPLHDSNAPTVVYGHRGISLIHITVYGPSGNIHSGHFGNVVMNPAETLATLLASFKSSNGRVVIPGYYDGIVITEAEKSAIAAIPVDHKQMATNVGVSSVKLVDSDYYTSLLYPSLNINSMVAADPNKPRTVIPANATARIDIRTVTATPGLRQVELIKTFMKSQGFHLTEGEPTELERGEHQKLASVTYLGGAAALQTPLTSPVGAWVKASMNTPPIEIPIMGGTVPTEGIAEGLGIPVVLLPLVNRDNNQHAPNENLRIGNYFTGSAIIESLLLTEFKN